MKHIAILDFGSQYTDLIARNIREQKVLSKVYPHDISASELKNALGIILSGGPQAVYQEDSIKADPEIFNLGIPILGICYGHQMLGHMLGGEVKPGVVHEYGRSKLQIKSDCDLFDKVSKETNIWMSHGDFVAQLPKDFICVGSTSDCEITAMANPERKIYGLQFHPEVDHTSEGHQILENFVLHICKAPQDWEIKDIVAHLSEKVEKQVKDRKVFVLVSGGVDSNVAFTLLTKALGKKRVLGLYIDTGFMRHEETKEITEAFERLQMDNLKIFDAKEIFFSRLKEVYEPEQKRQIIGQTFLDVKDQVAKDLGLNDNEWLLGQGTIYPDIIESGGTKNAAKIKTHHNRIDAIQKMIEQGLVVEPLVDFYKYEVRQIGKLLGLPDELINRHPFPGPGLAIRCLCHENMPVEDLSELKTKLDNLYQEKYPNIKHSLLPVRSVGVQGDYRTYAHPLAVWGENDWETLDHISVATTNAMRSVNRVIRLLNPKESENIFQFCNKNAYLSEDRVELLRRIDHVVHKNIAQADIYDDIWQFPVVLIPVTDESGLESVVLRPVNSRDVMTLHFYRMQENILTKIVKEIQATGQVSYVFYDITNKPPGTTEWE